MAMNDVELRGFEANQKTIPKTGKGNQEGRDRQMSMVDYDFATFGTPEERRRLLGRFDTEIHPPSQ